MYENSRYIKQGTPEWHQVRAGRFTSSEVWKLTVQPRSKKDQEAGVMSKTAQTYIKEKLQERLSGKPKESGDWKQTEWGNENEPLAISKYEQMTGNQVHQVGFIPHGENSGCSTDGFVSFDGIIEVKCPFSSYIDRVMENVAENRDYYYQIQDGLRITGRQWCDYVVFDPRMPEGMDISIERVLRDDAIIDLIETSIEKAEKALERMNKDFGEKILQTQKLAMAF